MDITWIIDLLERVGLPAFTIIVGAYLFFLVLKQSGKRDTSNGEFNKVFLGNLVSILDKLKDSSFDSKTLLIATKEQVGDLKPQIDNATEKIITKIDGVSTTITTKIDSHQATMLGQFTGVITKMVSVEQAIADAQKSHDTNLVQIGKDFLSLKGDVINAINSVLVSDKTKEAKNETNHVAVNPNFSSIE